MIKWVGIAIIVLLVFLTTLLALGYLLKENKAYTTELKHSLEQEFYDQQLKQKQTNAAHQVTSNLPLTAVEQSIHQIIEANLSCQTNKECVLFDTQQKKLGCMVALNTKGAAILIKVMSHQSSQTEKACLNLSDYFSTSSTACVEQQCIAR